MSTDQDIHYMRACLSMAQRGIGRTAENPSVGCIIVQNGVIIARARTANGGRPHAEALAFLDAGGRAKGATLYVSLEPCAHHGKTPPCVDAVIASGVARVVIAMQDPDPRTAGASIEKLENAGINVTCGVLEAEAKALNAGFVSRILYKRPYVTLKCACTLDGKIACANGDSQWITGDLARRHVHLMRSRHDAIMVGIETALHDDPILNVRFDGVNHKMTRVVMDRNLRIKNDSKLVQSACNFPLLILHEGGDDAHLRDSGARLIKVDCDDIKSVLNVLAEHGINNIMIEGGATLHTSFIKSGYVDTLMIYRAPTLLGASAKSVVSDLNIDKLAQRLDFERTQYLALGVDVLEIYKKRET